MKIDIHTHPPILSLFTDSKTQSQGGSSHALRRLRKIYKTAFAPELNQSPCNPQEMLNRYFAKFANWVRDSRFDKVVLLALDNAYDENGDAVLRNSHFSVDNTSVAKFAADNNEFLFGAGIHPYRKDAVKELERSVKLGAVVVKWIPSAQNINPTDKKCIPFYEALASMNIPLLVHTGIEHSIPGGNRSFNRPEMLKPALERGVKVIAAHCGMNMFLHEPSYFEEWCNMALEYEHFYGDTAALPLVTRVGKIRKITANRDLSSKMIYGSDFPTMPSPRWCWQLGVKKIRELCTIRNPLERNAVMTQELGFNETLFERGGEVLCLT